MRVIDEKGKLFGLINIVDLLVLLAILLVIGGAAYKIKGQKGSDAVRTVRATVLATALRPEMLTGIKVGDRMVSGSSFTDVVIKEIDIRPAYMITTDSQGRRVEAYDPYLKDLIVVVEGKTVISGGVINLGGQEIRSSKDYYIKSLTYDFKGMILDVVVE
ncbi:MAG TPA: DUF4330 domain-containing protein [Bacillota bacterium]|jgi:hypothetical protein|nr:DUF4330 domain-containing protein [Peptococcaceae bacterium MAG4]NLW37493.1 DUF4330 domain-containing protein [Peptococcaceae bacterium]HPU35821.1 DUF4330 domain-containing protein [Bacillota bacterium]HPZ43183.1 DUF4330 domain-containing protein [Bacillota bacterium]HQD75716.1 DUF4330 domain-containing protein [Bacillota bacterium]